ncbi:hypothetical protein [Desulfitobacterium sp. THU1]|uniref:hypothetical protein n=1 Tax=Desulfitobacterium sp. THU1 TaxID=3138072 RepID=UPI00311DF6C9
MHSYLYCRPESTFWVRADALSGTVPFQKNAPRPEVCRDIPHPRNNPQTECCPQSLTASIPHPPTEWFVFRYAALDGSGG